MKKLLCLFSLVFLVGCDVRIKATGDGSNPTKLNSAIKLKYPESQIYIADSAWKFIIIKPDGVVLKVICGNANDTNVTKVLTLTNINSW